MVLLIAGTEHPRLEVSSAKTRSPFAGVYEKVGPVLACGLPFTLHKYDGFVPPFVGLAVKVTDVPEQIVFALAVMLTEGCNCRINSYRKGLGGASTINSSTR